MVVCDSNCFYEIYLFECYLLATAASDIKGNLEGKVDCPTFATTSIEIEGNPRNCTRPATHTKKSPYSF
jgi:hypothetical protein